MRVVGRSKLDTFLACHGEARTWISAWLAEVCEARWETPHEIKARYPSVSILGAGCVIFNVKGNRYRLVCTVAYRTQVVVVDWVGTHAEYSKMNFGDR